MSLWTPWLSEAQETIRPYIIKSEEPLDLSKKPASIPTPEPVYSPAIVYPVAPVYYEDQHVPLVQFSPSSGSSSCSGCEVPSPSFPQTLTPAVPQSPSLFGSAIPDVESLSEDPEFQAYERAAMQVIAERNGGSLIASNPRMRRAVETSQTVDDSYRRQRQRNNFAAKMSRDKRKLREINMSLKVSFLKKKVAELKSQLSVATCVGCHRLGEW